MNDIDNRAIEYLSKNYLQNIPAIMSLRKQSGKVVFNDESGVIIYERQNGLYFVSSDGNGIISEFIRNTVLKNSTIISLRERNTEYLFENTDVLKKVVCHQVVYTGKPLKTDDVKGLEIKVLDTTYTDLVNDNYSLKLDREYIAKRISSSDIYGAFLDGAFAGFIGRHDEGSMGMLEVLPDYRRKGIGTALQHYILKVVLKAGEIPYAHIKEHNEPSLAMQRNLGEMVQAPEKIAFLIYD